MKEARRLCLASKVWGRPCAVAIETGQWDQGSVVQSFVPRAQANLKNRPTGQ